ncbi:GNAT family N-acetyltransferase [Parahaliea mediterranea]|uniref:GNAT family N-acetyltransferase n=1 Tax=Parahaliea mediterranea TaxID=651086 RepID=UPI000E2E6659|nr:GNAT family N-acetyltransferase [Parahaliea mediterranea]
MSELRWEIKRFEALSLKELYAALQLRQAVFVVEQDCPYQDLDGLDQDALHLLCWRGDALLATLRCLPPGLSYAQSSLGRIVVSPEARGLKLGRELVQRGIDFNLAQWPSSGIRIGAQAYLLDFYTSLGFVSEGDEYLEDGILHVHMQYRAPA